MKRLLLSFAMLTGLLGLSLLQAAKPNIVFIFVDDMGYSDIGCFGGEIETPEIDSLADEGIRLTNFRVTPMCVTSRASLLAGMEYSAAGYGNINNGLSFAHLLRDAGYHTSITGKVHAFGTLSTHPTQNVSTDYGFDRFFGFRAGATDNFTGSVNPSLQNPSESTWRLDNADYTGINSATFYATDAITDFTITFIDEAISQGKPFFTWVCYNAPHGKLQAPEADVRKYYDNGVYDSGWETLRKARFARQKTLGIVPQDMQLAKMGPEVPDWNKLPQTSSDAWVLQKDFETLCMSAYAAMMDKVDQNVGRIVAHLKNPDGDTNTADSVFDNTLIIFCSDNGGAYAGLYTDRNALPWDRSSSATFNTNYGWGALQNTPFRSYKHSGYEGGIRSPFVAHWPDGISLPNGTILHQSSNLWDFYPTFLELAGTSYPATYGAYGSTPTATKPLMGESIVPLFTDASSSAGTDLFISHFETRSKALIENNWKIVRYADGPWELYDMDADPDESADLAFSYPLVRDSLIAQWDAHFAANPPPGASWNLPTGSNYRNWGFDRIRTGLLTSIPEYMATNVPLDTKLSFTFKGAVNFSGTAGKKIRLQRYGSPEILWEADPEVSDPAQGTTSITFNSFPTLDANTHYYITWDNAWAFYNDNGTQRAVNQINEAAFAFRFKTASTYGEGIAESLTVAPGGTALPGDDNTGNGVPDLMDFLLTDGDPVNQPEIAVSFDESTSPHTPILTFKSRDSTSNHSLFIEYSPDLVTPFTSIFSITGNTRSTLGNAVASYAARDSGDGTDYTLRLDPSVVGSNRMFYRARATQSGEVPLGIWTFRASSMAPVKLSALCTPQAATLAQSNSGIIDSAAGFSFADPVISWAGSQLPNSGIGTQIQTAIVADQAMEVTRITYSGYLWSDRATGSVTNVDADVVAWFNNALDSPGIVGTRQIIVGGSGGTLLVPFQVSFPINGKSLNIGDKWDLRLRLQDGNGNTYTIDQEGFGIDAVTIYGKE
ncbi:MAG: sulfatase-like hydrolase/transferase [Akkermansiaceae bacterium]